MCHFSFSSHILFSFDFPSTSRRTLSELYSTNFQSIVWKSGFLSRPHTVGLDVCQVTLTFSMFSKQFALHVPRTNCLKHSIPHGLVPRHSMPYCYILCPLTLVLLTFFICGIPSWRNVKISSTNICSRVWSFLFFFYFFFLLQTQRHSYNRNLHYLQTLTVHPTWQLLLLNNNKYHSRSIYFLALPTYLLIVLQKLST